MTSTTKPDKQAVRDWLDRRAHEDEAPPTPEEVRRQLGWGLVPENGKQEQDE